jgi:predicted nucleotidyltransferase
VADPALDSPEIRLMLGLLQQGIQQVLGAKLAGLYVVGSLVTGDFDFRSSDLDLIAVLADDPTEAEIAALGTMHAEIARQQPRWDDRIEVIYVTAARLKGDMADYTFPITSPGEPFHIRDIHHDDWIVNWHNLREVGLPLLGADPKTLVAPVSREWLAEVVRTQARMTLDWISPSDPLGSQAYAMLTLCRALVLVRTGQSVSKKQAAAWVAERYPHWADLAERMLIWRAAGVNQMPGHAEQFPETLRFVDFILAQLD